MSAGQRAAAALNRLCKWRTVFAGWQLGTRTKDDPEAEAVRDHRELSMILRVEVTALTKLLIQKGVITEQEFSEAIANEADLLSKDFAERFPGIEATDTGLKIDAAKMQRHGTLEGWKP